MLLAAIVLVVARYGDGAAQNAGFTVISNPPGAEIRLIGESVVTGITPTTFSYPLIGEYKLELRKTGYETYQTKVVLDPTREASVQANLKPRTAAKAAVRSLFIPGWGQRYSGQSGKGFLFTLLAAGSVAGFLIVDNDYQEKYDQFADAQADYDKLLKDGSSYAAIEAGFSRLQSQQERAYDAETNRRITIGAVAGVWTLSLLDALFFFPDNRSTFTVRNLSLAPDIQRGGVQLTLATAW